MIAAIAQTTTGVDPAANAAALSALIAEASAGGANILFTPEMSGMLDRDRTRMSGNIRSEDEDPVLEAVRAAAARHGLWVQLGSLALRADDGGDDRLVNRSFLIDAAGNIKARYDKIHLFDVDLPTGEVYRESSHYRPGDTAVVADTPWGRIGLSICYDLRFPALYQRLAEAGVTIFSIPAAFTVPTGEAHWHVLMRARAIEAGVHVVAAAQTGQHEDGRKTYGHSLAIDPWGEILVDMGDPPGLSLVNLDPGVVQQVRTRIPALSHRRAIPPASVCS